MPVKVGSLRPTQLIFTFGVGASIELPRITGIVMGLEDWDENYLSEISEQRVLQAVQGILGPQVSRLCAPPLPEKLDTPLVANPDEDRVGVPIATFPTWLRCPLCNRLGKAGKGMFELRVVPRFPDRTEYVHANCLKARRRAPAAVPARFLVACEHGHFDDFPWIEFAHRGEPCASPLLRLSEYGVSGTAADVSVACDTCKKSQNMSLAFGEEGKKNMPPCSGRRAHLRDSEDCDQQMKAILLGASNSWFPLSVAALYVPTGVDDLGRRVEEKWAVLEKAEGIEIIKAFRGIGQLQEFGDYSDEQIWTAVESKKSGAGAEENSKNQDLKAPEWAAFSHPDTAPSMPDFELCEVAAPSAYSNVIEKVVLAERVREVRALVGFTRIESPGDFGESCEIPADRRGPMTRTPPKWVPASEVRGEGIFIQFQEKVVADWAAVETQRQLEADYRVAYHHWCTMRDISPSDSGFPGVRFVLLHSFAHALMRQFALECGYAAASLRERVYSRSPDEEQGPMAGVLIYTAAPDSEGTLGGVVSLGQPAILERHIGQALERIRLCAGDPLCAEHHPHRDGVTLHGAACHACLFAPETSCERGNRFIDRNVLLQTVNGSDNSFFRLHHA